MRNLTVNIISLTNSKFLLQTALQRQTNIPHVSASIINKLKLNMQPKY